MIIKQKLTSYWSKLGTNDIQSTEDILNKLDVLQQSGPAPDSFQQVKIDKKSLLKAIKRLQNSKATGCDNIPGEFIKYCDESAQLALLDMLTEIKITEQLPDEWMEGIVKPLHKDGNREILGNYRGITISSVAYKTLVLIMEDQIMQYLEDRNIFGETQGAFRPGRRCEDHIFTLKGVCAIRKSKRNKTYLAFMDITKAFDRLDRNRLFYHIYIKGIQGKAWRLVKALYEKVDNKVIFGDIESNIYSVTSGVKQGCVLSPCLFNLVMLDLNDMLNGVGGVNLDGYNLRGLFYADDIVLLAAGEKALQDMLNVTNAFAEKWGLSFSEKKSQVLIVGGKPSDKLWPLGNKFMKETNTYKYLGVAFNSKLKDNYHVNDILKPKCKRQKVI